MKGAAGAKGTRHLHHGEHGKLGDASPDPYVRMRREWLSRRRIARHDLVTTVPDVNGSRLMASLFWGPLVFVALTHPSGPGSRVRNPHDAFDALLGIALIVLSVPAFYALLTLVARTIA